MRSHDVDEAAADHQRPTIDAHSAPAHDRRAALIEVLLTAVAAFLLFFVGTADVPLIPRDEARFGEAAREMFARGELVVPTFGGENRYDKPILVYWCTVASYAVLGVDERAARLTSNLAGAATVLLLAWSARRRWGRGAGLLAGLLLTVTVTFHVQARACTADLVMMLPTVAAMLALERLWLGDDRRRNALVVWLGMGLAALAKGPVGPAVALFAALALWAMDRTWRRWELAALAALLVAGWWRLGPVVLLLPVAVAAFETLRSPVGRAGLAKLRWGWGAPLLLAVVLPWSVAALVATEGEFFRVGVGRHVVERSVSALESHGGFPGFYVLTGLVVAFPWFAFAWPAVRRAVADPSLRFMVAWFLGPLVLLELVATKLVHYWMPSYPAGVLLVVGWLVADSGQPRRLARRWRVALAAGGLVLAAVPVVVSVRLDLPHLLLPAALAGLPLVVGTAWAVVRSGRRPLRAVAALVVATAAFLVLVLVVFLPRLSTFFVGPRAARLAREMRRPDERILVYKAHDDEIFFYLPLDVINCRSRSCLVDRMEQGTPFFGLARELELDRFQAEYGHLELELVELIGGVDPGRGEWTRIAMFRPGTPSDPGVILLSDRNPEPEGSLHEP